MNIFALQTSIDVLRRQYTIEGEEVLLMTHYHWISWIMHTYKRIGVVSFILLLCALIFAFELMSTMIFIPVVAVLFGYSLWVLINGFILYRYNFLIVTSEKVLFVDQRSFFYQHLNPMQLDTIVSTDVNSQLFGMFDCGELILNLTQRTQYSSKQLHAKYLPRAASVAGIIENAITLNNKRKSGVEEIHEQQGRMGEIQKQADHVVKDDPITDHAEHQS